MQCWRMKEKRKKEKKGGRWIERKEENETESRDNNSGLKETVV